MQPSHTLTLRRLLAFALDWLLVLLWGGALFGGVMIASGGDPPRPATPWRAQAVGLLSMTLPVVLYFTACEASSLRASLGKRALGLVVRGVDGRRLPLRSSLLRNALKFAPWECGHTVAQQAVFAGEGGFATWVWIPATISCVGPAWWILAAMRTGVAPYDRWSRARVAPRTPSPR